MPIIQHHAVARAGGGGATWVADFLYGIRNPSTGDFSSPVTSAGSVILVISGNQLGDMSTSGSVDIFDSNDDFRLELNDIYQDDPGGSEKGMFVGLATTSSSPPINLPHRRWEQYALYDRGGVAFMYVEEEVSFVNAAYTDYNFESSAVTSPAVPSGTQVGDLIIVTITGDILSPTPAVESGWTDFADGFATNSSGSARAAYKTAESSDLSGAVHDWGAGIATNVRLIATTSVFRVV